MWFVWFSEAIGAEMAAAKSWRGSLGMNIMLSEMSFVMELSNIIFGIVEKDGQFDTNEFPCIQQHDCNK